MFSEPVPPLFELYFYSAIVVAVLVSLIAVVLYRRAVLRNMLIKGSGIADSPEQPEYRPILRNVEPAAVSNYLSTEHRLKSRLGSIYIIAILAVSMLAVWIRFCTGTLVLFSGSAFYVMWEAFLGSFIA